MKKIVRSGSLFVLLCSSLYFVSCKGKPSTTTTTDTATITTTTPTDNTNQHAPDTAVVISTDDSLKSQLTAATKDFPGVSATTDQGIVTLSGTIRRDKLPKLMMNVNALHPKKVNNNLTVK